MRHDAIAPLNRAEVEKLEKLLHALKAQGKLVRVVQGEVFDVVVDLRKTAATFGQWDGVHLSADNHRQLWVPPGFAHGFVVLSETAEFLYKTTDYWFPEYERSLLWNDPAIGIEWPIDFEPQLAAKDQAGRLLCDAEVFDHGASA